MNGTSSSVVSASKGRDDMTNLNILKGRPEPSVQTVFAADVIAPPAVMLDESPPEGMSTDDISIERYFSKD